MMLFMSKLFFTIRTWNEYNSITNRSMCSCCVIPTSWSIMSVIILININFLKGYVFLQRNYISIWMLLNKLKWLCLED